MRHIVAAIMATSHIAHLTWVEADRAPHPRLRADASDPVGERWNSAEVFKNMLLANQTYRHMAPDAVDDRDSKDRLREPDSFRMVPESAMAEVGDDLFRPVDYMDSM
jgi:hypothetical protein